MFADHIIDEVKKTCLLNNIEVFIDKKSLIKDRVVCFATENFMGFCYVSPNGEENFLTFNTNVLRYALLEGFEFDNIYSNFEKKLFTVLDKEQFFNKLINHHE
jgi:hypothetical protein